MCSLATPLILRLQEAHPMSAEKSNTDIIQVLAVNLGGANFHARTTLTISLLSMYPQNLHSACRFSFVLPLNSFTIPAIPLNAGMPASPMHS